MEYNVYIQNQFYAIITANNTGEVLTKIAKDISENKVNFDHSISQNIRIEPKV